MLRIVIWDHHGAGVPFREAAAGTCEIYWANWGYNRIRLESADEKTRKACGGKRGGFISMIPPKVTVMVVLKWNRCFPYSETGDGKRKW